MQYAKIKDMEQRGDTKKSVFGKGLEPAEHYVQRNTFLDEKALERETLGLAEVGTSFIPIIRELLESQNNKTVRKWNEMASKSIELNKAEDRLRNTIQESKLGGTILGSNLERVLKASAGIVTFRGLEKQKKIANRNGFLSPINRFFEWGEFAISGSTIFKIGGVSIRDIMYKQNLSLPEFFQQYMKAQLVSIDSLHEGVLRENQNIPFALLFPNSAKRSIQEAAGNIIGLWNIGTLKNSLKHIADKADPLEVELGSTAQTMIEKVDALKERIYQTILDPTSSEFKELKTMAFKYLRHPDQEVRLRTVLALGIGSAVKENTIVDAYRKAKKLGQEKNENTDFYNTLKDSIIAIILDSHVKQELLTREEVVLFLDESKGLLPTIQIPTIEDFRQINNLTFQKTSNKSHSVNPKIVDWHNLTPASEILVTFDKNLNTKFNINLHYENDEGEALNFNLKFDTKRGELDWPFLEDPNDPEMKEMKNAIMLVTKDILIDIQKQAKEEWEEKQKAKIVKINGSNGKSVTSSQAQLVTPYTPREKEERGESQRHLTPVQQVLSGEISMQSKERVKGQIVLLPEEEMQKMLNGISLENQTMILEKIREFNEKGAGIFKALPGYAGEGGGKIYELRTGDYRVLLIERASGNGNGNKVREFEIYKVGNRREIFKKRQKN